MRNVIFFIISILISILIYKPGLAAEDGPKQNIAAVNLFQLIPSDIALENDKVLPADKYIGSLKAPIVMIEYASFSCPHCASFSNNILPLIKEKYIDTGKVLFIYRDFPLDALSFKASVLSRCYASYKHCQDSCPQDDKNCCAQARDYFNLYKALFDSIQHWSYSYEEDTSRLLQVAKIGKMNEKEFNACIADKEIQNQVMNSKIYAIRKLEINSSPVFLINGEKYEGKSDFDSFANTFDKIIQASAK